MTAELIDLALEYYRAPLRYRQLTESAYPIGKTCEDLVEAFGTALGPNRIEATAAGLGTTPQHLQTAALFFVRQVLLAPGSNYYRILGLSSNATTEKVRQHYRLLVRMLHPDRSPSDVERNTTAMVRINEAYDTLRSPQTRQAYDRKLTAVSVTDLENNPALSRSVYSAPQVFDAPAKIRPQRRRVALITILSIIGLTSTVVVTIIAMQGNFHKSALQINSNLASRSPSKPSFLGGDPPPNNEPLRVIDSSENTYAGSTRQPTPTRVAPLAGNLSAQAISRDSSQDKPEFVPESEAETGSKSKPEPEPKQHLPTLALSRDNSQVQPELAPESETEAEPKSKPEPEPKQKTKLELASRGGSPPQANRDKLNILPSASDRLSKPDKPNSPARKDLPKQSAGISRPAAETKTPTVDHKKANRIISRLTRYYGSGNLDGLVQLFDASARVNEGRGTAFIRADYHAFFQRTSERRLSIRKLRWRTMENGNLAGKGIFEANTRTEGSASRHRHTGTIEFELLELGGAYKIAKMLHSHVTKTTTGAQQSKPDRTENSVLKDPSRTHAKSPSSSRPEPPSIDLKQANHVLSRFTRCYKSGDLNCIVRLFSANARVNGGSGTAFIRSDYAAFFQDTSERRLSIRKVRWKKANRSVVTGSGSFESKTRSKASASWQRHTGTIRFELITLGNSYKISEMKYSYGP